MAEEVVSQVVGKVRGDISDLKTKYVQAKSETTGLKGFLQSSMKDIAGTALGFLTGSAIQQGIGFLVGGFKSLVEEGIDYNATLEQTETAFDKLLGSKAKGDAFVQMLQQFSDVTPFEAQPIEDAAQEMLAFGFKAQQVKPYLTAIGDALSDMGHADSASLEGITTIFGQINASATTQTQDLRQFTSYGINAFAILANTIKPTKQQVDDLVKQGLVPASGAMQLLSGKTKLTQSDVQALVTAGLIPGKDAANDLATGLEKTYGGGMAAQAQTFNGLVSTLKSHLEQALGALTGPLFDLAKQGLGQLVTWMSSKDVTNFIKQIGTDLADGLKKAGDFLGTLKQDFLDAFSDKNGQKVKDLKQLASDLKDKFVDLGNWVKDHLADALEGLATDLGNVASWLSQTKEHVQDVVMWWQAWGPLIETVGGAITLFFLPAIIKSGVEAVISGEKVAQTFIMSIINSGKEAVIAAGKLWGNAFSWVASIDMSGQKAEETAGEVDTLSASEAAAGDAAETGAAQVDTMAASEDGLGTSAGAAEALDGLAAAEEAVGTNAEASAGQVDTLSASTSAMGDASSAALGAGGAGAAAGLGVLGLLGGMMALGGWIGDQSSKEAGQWIASMLGIQNQTDDAAGSIWNITQQLKDFQKDIPPPGTFKDILGNLLNLENYADDAAVALHNLDVQWANMMFGGTGFGPPQPGAPPPTQGKPRATGGMVGPQEMLTLINDQGGRGELVHLHSGDYVYPHNQSVTKLQQMGAGAGNQGYAELVNEVRMLRQMMAANPPTNVSVIDPKAFDQMNLVRAQRNQVLYGR